MKYGLYKTLKRSLSPALLALALAFIFYSCPGTAPASADKGPSDEAVRAELKKSVSSVNITFEASSQAITAALNQMVGKDIYKGATQISGLTADIVRNGPINVTASDNYIYLNLPVTMSLRYGGFKTPAITSSLKFKLSARITPDWKINADIQYMGLSGLFADEAGIGPLSINPRSIIEGITQPLQRVISDLVSRKINEKYSLRAEMVKIWNAAQKPVRVNNNSAWLKITPQEVTLYPLYAAGNQVKLSLGLKSFAELVVGPEPPAPVPVPLPDLKLGARCDNSFRIALNTDIFYKDILTVAAPLLLNKELGSDGKSIILKNIDIYSSGDKLAVKVEASGSYNGVFYLTSRPSFDQQTNTFSVEDVDFEMETHNILLKTAGWLLHGKIRSIIKEKLNMDLTERMRQAHEMAQKAMDQVQLADRIYLKGRVKAIKLYNVIVQKEKISVQVFAEGETTVHFQ